MAEEYKPSLPRPFKAWLAKGGILTLVAASDLSERSWAAWFGDFQDALDKRQWMETDISICVVDLRQCRWADPLPLLSLTLSLAKFEAKGGEVKLHLPEICLKSKVTQLSNSGQGSDQKKHLDGERLLKFMAREGFLDLLVRTQPITRLEGGGASQQLRPTSLGNQSLQLEHLQAFRELRSPLAFEESTCVPAVLLTLGMDSSSPIEYTLKSIDRWVRQTIQTRIHPVVMDKVPAWAHGGLLYRLQILLLETLHNIVEHAYGESGGMAAVYVRYREGRLGQAPSTWRTMETHIKREDDSNRIALMGAFPIYQAFSRTRAGFFEIYVLDEGCGLIERLLQNETVQHIRASANPLHQVMLEVFNGRSTRKDRPTEKGGIYLLRHLLEPSRDYLRVRDADSWWGRELPLPMSQSNTTPAGQFTVDCGAVRHDCLPIRGLAWTARLSWLDRMDSAALPEVGNWREMTQQDRRPLLKILRNNAAALTNLSINVEDQRLTGSSWESLSHNQGSDILMVLPRPDWMKNQIQDHLLKHLKAKRLHQNSTLVVGDIVSEEALTYLLAIRRARRLVTGVDEIPARIILITRDLRSIVLCPRDGMYQEDETETAAFVCGKSPWSLEDYFCALRAHDGQRLWESIDNGPLAAFRREWVDWHDGRCLDGYLDFPTTLTNPVCRAIYNLALEHLTALFPQRDCRLIPLDNLVESLVVRFRAQQRPRRYTFAGNNNANAIDVYLGSVRVTGFTEQDHISQDEHPTVFHLFCHPSGESFRQQSSVSPGYYLLPWLGPLRGTRPHDCTAETQPRDWYRRIGRTPGIAQGGWKAFRMPRFDKEGQSLYEATPHETYRAWQDPSRTPLRLGHWSYGGHHDLLTVNLLLAFDTELDQISLALGGKLARFVYANLFAALGILRDHLKDDGKRLWDMIEKDAFRRLVPRSYGEQGGILIFPSHPVTDHVLARLTSWLQDEKKLYGVLTHCVPILPLRRHRGGSGLQLSGLTIERLQSFVTQDGAPPVTYFDDAMISGHTFQQMKSLLHELGFQQVYSLIMLDRQRLPSANHVNRQVDLDALKNQEQKPTYQNVSYWRLDAPTIGSRAHCPLCKGLGRVKDLAGGIKSPDRRERALHWLDIWAERNPATDWGDAGLRPIPLELNKPNRKFCIEPDPNNMTAWKQAGADGKEIILTNSAGLVAWVTELHSITGRDDLVMKLLDQKSEKITPEARIQLCASQLLLFHGEFDRDLADTLGYQLVLALYEAPTHDRNTALAAITLLACGNKFLSVALQRLHLSRGSNANTVMSDSETNQDFLTLLELNSVMEARFRSTLQASPLILSAPLRREIYRLLQENICSGEPDHHSSMFARFQSVSTPPRPFDHGILERVVESAESLKRVLTDISPGWFRYHGEAYSLIGNFEAFRNAIYDRLADITTTIKIALDSACKSSVSGSNFELSKAQAKEILADGHRVALAVFTPLGVLNLQKVHRPLILDELQKVVDSACHAVGPEGWRIAIAEPSGRYYCDASNRLNNCKKEYYVIWDRLVKNALDKILSNVRHAEKEPIPCPWPELADTSKDQQPKPAHLWMLLDIQAECVSILLRSNTKTHAEEITKLTKDKHWIKTFVELGGCVTYSNPNFDKLLQTTIQIPYSFFLD